MNESLTEHQAANEANCVSALEFLKIANKTLQRTGNSAAFLFSLNKKTDSNSSFSFRQIFSLLGGGGGGYSLTFYTGRLRPKGPTPYPLIKHFWQRRYPLSYLIALLLVLFTD